jgi:hypothetical protein
MLCTVNPTDPISMAMDSLRDEIWQILLMKDGKIQMRYESAGPDAFPMPKKEYLHPDFDQEVWDTLVKAYAAALEVLRGQMIYDLVNPLPKEKPMMRKNPDTGLFEYVYP